MLFHCKRISLRCASVSRPCDTCVLQGESEERSATWCATKSPDFRLRVEGRIGAKLSERAGTVPDIAGTAQPSVLEISRMEELGISHLFRAQKSREQLQKKRNAQAPAAAAANAVPAAKPAARAPAVTGKRTRQSRAPAVPAQKSQRTLHSCLRVPVSITATAAAENPTSADAEIAISGVAAAIHPTFERVARAAPQAVARVHFVWNGVHVTAYPSHATCVLLLQVFESDEEDDVLSEASGPDNADSEPTIVRSRSRTQIHFDVSCAPTAADAGLNHPGAGGQAGLPRPRCCLPAPQRRGRPPLGGGWQREARGASTAEGKVRERLD